jgi:hypothetical protein
VRDRPGINEEVSDHWIEKHVADLDHLASEANSEPKTAVVA